MFVQDLVAEFYDIIKEERILVLGNLQFWNHISFPFLLSTSAMLNFLIITVVINCLIFPVLFQPRVTDE